MKKLFRRILPEPTWQVIKAWRGNGGWWLFEKRMRRKVKVVRLHWREE